MKKFLALLMALVMTLALVACGGGNNSGSSAPADSGSSAAPADTSAPADTGAYDALDPVELIGADSTGKGAAGQIFGEYVASRVEEITGGKLTIDYHPNGDLGGDADLIRQMQNNEIQIEIGRAHV